VVTVDGGRRRRAGRRPPGHPQSGKPRVTDSLDQHDGDLNWLVGAAEASLISAWRSARASGDDQAAEREAEFLLRANASLVRMAGRRYRLRRLDREDLDQSARLGLLQALARFDPLRGRFPAYAVQWMRKEAQRVLANGEFSVAIPAHLPGRLVALRSLGAASDDKAAQSLDLSPVVVAALRPLLDAVPLPDAFEDAPRLTAAPAVLGEDDQEPELAWALEAALSDLPTDLSRVVVLTHGLAGGGPRSTRKVAGIVGVSDFTVRARLARAYRILAARVSDPY